MKFSILFLFLIPLQTLLAQDAEKAIIKTFIKKANGNTIYLKNNKNGDMIYFLYKNIDGDITAIEASEYDSLNKTTKSYSVYDFLGYSLSEDIEEEHRILHYSYKTGTDESYPANKETLNTIKTRDDFIHMDVFQELEKRKRHLWQIDLLDSSKNKIKEIHLAENGDTTDIATYKYNAENLLVNLHIGTTLGELLASDTYYSYDEHNNLVKSFTVTASFGINDTSDLYNYKYDRYNRLISEIHYDNGRLKSRSENHYNKNDQITKCLSFDGSESKPYQMTIYKYDKHGNEKKKIQFNYQKPKKEQKEVTTTKYKYW